MGYWAQVDFDAVENDNRTLTITMTDTAGDPVSIVAYEFDFKAVLRSDTTKAWTVANAATTQTDSGTGTTDTVEIPINADDYDGAGAAAPVGRWDYQVVLTDTGNGDAETTIMRGTLNVPDRL